MVKILLVKTSSMGDVIHNLPVATDIKDQIPGASIDWAVEESLSDIPALHAAVSKVIPVAFRRWRKDLHAGAVEFGRFKTNLRAQDYDIVLDTQGLIKSAIIARVAKGVRCGYAWGSCREPIASLAYQKTFRVPWGLHAVERNRRLAAQAFDYPLRAGVDYGVAAPAINLPWLPAQPYCVFFHSSSWPEKLWPEENWRALGAQLAAKGVRCVLPAGTDGERARSLRLAQQIPGAVAAPALSLKEIAAMVSGAKLVIGVDTGLTHLAAVLARPVVGIYCATSPGLTGIYGAPDAVNLGGERGAPELAQVIAEADRVLSPS